MNRDQRKQILIAAGAVIAVIAVLRALRITCLIKFMTGISCPGCGMTRAWIAFCGGHFHRAMDYHPLFLTVLPVAAYLVIRSVLKRRGVPNERFVTADRIVLAVFCLALFICYGLRMADPTDTIVVCRPREGIVYRLITWLTTR